MHTARRRIHRSALFCALLVCLALPAAASANGGITPEVVTGGSHTCALADNGVVSCWGGNAQGQLGTGDTNPRPTPTPVAGLEGATTIGATDRGTCAAKNDGTVWCWGANDFSQLAQGTQDSDPHPTPVAVTGLKDVYWLVGGANHMCAVSWSEALKCWGSNVDGQVGTGSVGGSVNTPTAIAGVTYVKGLAAGADFTCVAGKTATVRCWGMNDKGQLGVPAGPSSGTPVAVPGVEGAHELQAGSDSVCAKTWSKDHVVCWGDNFYGQIGQGTTGETVPRVPTGIATLGDPKMLGGTSGSICTVAKTITPEPAVAPMSGGSTESAHGLKCWGQGTSGRLGVGNENHSGTPLAVGLSDVATLSYGSTSGTQCAVVRGGGLFCWGDNSSGQAGVGSAATAILIPTVVPGVDLVTRPQYPYWASMEPKSKLKRNAAGTGRVVKTKLTIEPSPFVFAADACKGNVVANAFYLKKVRKKKSAKKSGGVEYRKVGVRTKKTKLRRSGPYCTARFVQTLPDSKFAGKRPIYISASFFGNEAMSKFSGGDHELTKKRKGKK